MKAVIAAVIAWAAVGTALYQVSASRAPAPTLAAARVTPLDKDPIDCTFAHPQYVGTCVEKVTPTEKQTPVQACRVILDCLNSIRCVKTYCQATTIRGGWSLVSPKPKKH